MEHNGANIKLFINFWKRTFWKLFLPLAILKYIYCRGVNNHTYTYLYIYYSEIYKICTSFGYDVWLFFSSQSHTESDIWFCLYFFETCKTVMWTLYCKYEGTMDVQKTMKGLLYIHAS